MTESDQVKALEYLRKALGDAYLSVENKRDIVKALSILERVCFGLSFEKPYTMIQQLKLDILLG